MNPRQRAGYPAYTGTYQTSAVAGTKKDAGGNPTFTPSTSSFIFTASLSSETDKQRVSRTLSSFVGTQKHLEYLTCHCSTPLNMPSQLRQGSSFDLTYKGKAGKFHVGFVYDQTPYSAAMGQQFLGVFVAN